MPVQLLKALPPIDVTDGGIVTVVSPLHILKALSPIVATDVPIVALLALVQ